MSGAVIDRTAQAMRREIERSPWRGRPAKTIFFGGGTPTFFPVEQLVGLLQAVLDAHPPTPDAEITSEANPGTVDRPKFAAMREAGFNRISLGAQSFASGDLMRLGRVHQGSEVAVAVESARAAGFDNVSLDLMFALPGQTLHAWGRNLDLALALRPRHLSLYCLTIEPNTRFHRLHQRGMLELPDDEVQVSMYELAIDRCAAVGLAQYEISNFAQPGFESQHNLCYWRSEEYLGYGPGAVGAVWNHEDLGDVRTTNLKHPERYAEAVESGTSLWCEIDRLSPDDRRLEKIMMGLRLTEGLPRAGLDLNEKVLARLTERGWIEAQPDRVRLTRVGRHFCSEVALELSD